MAAGAQHQIVSFPYNVYTAAVCLSLACSLLTMPAWRRWCIRIGLVDDPGHRKIHDRPIVLAGGPTALTAMLLPVVLGCLGIWGLAKLDADQLGIFGLTSDSIYLLEHGLNRRLGQLVAIFFGAIGMTVVGFLDDKHELKAGPKFFGQLLIGLLVAASGVRITLFIPNLVVSYALTVLWVLTVVNAFNFMDNMNGLCTGLGAIGAFFFGLIASFDGQYLVASIAFLTFGALLGFLPYNFPNARAFLGDAGSHLVGYLLAVLAILPHFHNPKQPRPWAVLVPLLVLAVPLLDMVRVVVVRWSIGRPFYIGDNNHFSHLLVKRGHSRTAAVVIIWVAAVLGGGLAILLGG